MTDVKFPILDFLMESEMTDYGLSTLLFLLGIHIVYISRSLASGKSSRAEKAF
jgi:hypothetical protein